MSERETGPAALADARTTRLVDATAVAATAAFAGCALLTQTVIVPTWRALEPAAFLPHFAVYGPRTGATAFPFEVASVLLLGRATYATITRHRPGWLAWALATAGMVGTVALLPLYFVPANLALLNPAFPLQAVPAALAAWYRWNWARTSLGLASAALACMALTASRGAHAAIRGESRSDPAAGSAPRSISPRR